MISRRRFIKTAAQIVASASLIGTGLHLRHKGIVISFNVAGSKYFPNLPDLRSGKQVYLVRGLFNGDICYKVTTSGGETIGYVPKQNIAEVSRCDNRCWMLTISDPNALPWKRYVVSCC